MEEARNASQVTSIKCTSDNYPGCILHTQLKTSYPATNAENDEALHEEHALLLPNVGRGFVGQGISRVVILINTKGVYVSKKSR